MEVQWCRTHCSCKCTFFSYSVNIPVRGGCGSVENGSTLLPYLPPVPPQGTGFHRYVFSLYTHATPLSQDPAPVTPSGGPQAKEGWWLEQRTFSSAEFLSSKECDMKPWSFAFFQCQWDKSVSHTYKHIISKCLVKLVTALNSEGLLQRKSENSMYSINPQSANRSLKRWQPLKSNLASRQLAGDYKNPISLHRGCNLKICHAIFKALLPPLLCISESAEPYYGPERKLGPRKLRQKAIYSARQAKYTNLWPTSHSSDNLHLHSVLFCHSSKIPPPKP